MSVNKNLIYKLLKEECAIYCIRRSHLRKLRDAANLRQLDVARALGVSQTAICHWETGQDKPSKKYHEKLAELYHVTVADIVREADM